MAAARGDDGVGAVRDALPISRPPPASKSGEAIRPPVLVVMPRVFAPQFVTYDLQFRRCLSLRIEIYGLTIGGGGGRG